MACQARRDAAVTALPACYSQVEALLQLSYSNATAKLQQCYGQAAATPQARRRDGITFRLKNRKIRPE